MVMKVWVVVFWVMTPCSDVIGYQCSGGPCCLHLQAKVNGAGKGDIEMASQSSTPPHSSPSPCFLLAHMDSTPSCILCAYFYAPPQCQSISLCTRSQYGLPKHCYPNTSLCIVIPQKTMTWISFWSSFYMLCLLHFQIN